MDLIQSLGTVQSAATFINYSAPQVALNVAFAFILSLLTALVYQFTHKGHSYSKNFVTSLIIISIVVSVVMMVIGNSLARAFALLGAFSIIRFRTAVKDTKDIAFVFLALVIGMAAGTNNYIIGLIGTLLILIVIILLSKVNLTGAERSNYTLSVFVKNNKNKDQKGEDIFSSKILDRFIKRKDLLSISTRDSGKLIEHVFAIDFKNKINTEDFLRDLTSVNSIEKVHLFSTKQDIEY